MKTLTKIGYATLATALVAEQTFAQGAGGTSMFGYTNVQGNIQGSTGTADKTIQNLISNALLFLAILAVVYGIYGGFLMMTAGGEEDKMKKGRTILLQVAIGLVVIFLANSIVSFVLTNILKPGA